MKTINPFTLLRRFDRQAIDQLRDEVARLSVEADRLRVERDVADQTAEFWREQCYVLEDAVRDQGGQLGMDPSGRIGVVD